mgnify:CR=1 FL=1
MKHGEYRIERLLGQGGFGITYEAEQVSLRRKVAVKEFFMKDSCERDGSTSYVTVPTASNRELVSKFKDKFIREARMIAALDHEHIVKIHDVFEENSTAYYVMEYLGGGSLGEGVKAGKAMPGQEAISSIRQIASALEYLHKKGIIHFDVKPSNVLRTEDGKLKLIDFGISKHYDEAGVQTSSTPVGISKGYAPLEQYKQGSDLKSFTPATDIYSLGATLYALLAGANPPEASDVNDDGLPVIYSVSPKVMRAVEKAMQPRRKDRPQSVSGFLKLLDSPETDEEETVVTISASDTKETKTDKEQQSSLKPGNAQKSGEKKPKSIPKWLYGVAAGIAVAVLAAIMIPKFISHTGKIAFDSNPQGAEVWLDGDDSGSRTPCILSDIPYGTHSVTYRLDGYCEYNDSLEVSARKAVDFSACLSVAFGRLEVNGTPAGMEIFIDGVPTGKKTGKTAVVMDSVLVGTHKVELKLKQYKDCLVEVAVNDGETAIVTAKAEYDWPAPSGKHNGHDYMDLGLSVKWATCNVGSTSPEGYGSYFAWGETSPKSDYSWTTLKYCNDTTGDSFSKYNQTKGGTRDNRTVLELSDDAARANWGGSWRMPTYDELQELDNKCTWKWITINGKNGYKVTSKSNGNSIFLPASGWRKNMSLYRPASLGFYWSSELYIGGSGSACVLRTYEPYKSEGDIYVGSDDRSHGYSVRPVFR